MLISRQIFELNDHMDVKVKPVGKGRHKLVLADNFYKHPELVIELASDLYYTVPMTGNFPGVRAQISLDTQPVIEKIGQLWGEDVLPYQYNYQPVIFSAITTNNYRLNVAQRMPHVDEDLTAMVYLNPPGQCVGGTGLYRHRPTGLERLPVAINDEILSLGQKYEINPEYLKTPDDYGHFVNTLVFNPLFATEENSYINDGNEYWELLELMEMKHNRLVIFDGRMFHSQYIPGNRFSDQHRVNQILYLRRSHRDAARSTVS